MKPQYRTTSGGGGRSSGSWRDAASGSGQRFTGDRASRAAAGTAGAKDCRGVLGRFRAWRELGGKLREIGGTMLGRFRKRCGRSRARREKSTAAAWKGQRNGRVRRRGRTGSQCVTVVALSIGTGSRTWCWRSGWSRCGPQPLILGGCPRKNVDPMQQEDWPNRLDGVNAGGFRQGLQDAPEVPQCGGGLDVARADEGGMSQHRFKGTAFAYGSQSW